MAATKPHLRERLLSPDPIKSSIIRDSGLGWLSSPSSNNGGPSSQSSQDSDSANGSITSPLRIAKRTSSSSPRPLPQQPGQRLNRRSSNSYKHMATNSLVSKSPFKTAGFKPISTLPPKNAPIPIPVTRRVSGEKRSRPVSIHNQAEHENDRPFALKRERRQSKSYQGLVNKTHVSKSPFRSQRTPSVEEPPVPEPSEPFPNVTTNSHAAPSSPPAPPAPPAPTHPLEPPTPPNSNGPSPGRSNLRPRRMHGPRVSNGYKRERRKTVTWDERMEVVEFDRDEVDDDEDLFDGGHPDNTSDCSPQEEDPFFHGSHAPDNMHYDSNGHQDQYDEEIHRANFSGESGPMQDMEMNTHDNISGLVDELFASSNMPPSMGNMHSPHQNEGYDHNSHVEHEAQFLNSFDEHDGTDGGRDEEDQGALSRFRRQHSRSPSLHHIQDFSPQPNAQSSPAGSRHYTGSPIPSSLVPSRPSSRQSADSPRPGSATGTPSRALPQTPQVRFPQSSTPTSERSIHSQHASPQDYVGQLPASPSPRSSRRISNPDREEAYMSFEASYHSMQEQANTSSSSLHDELNHSGRNEEDMSHGSMHGERQATIFIPDIPEASTEGPRPSTSRRSSAAEMGNQMNAAFQFPRRSQSPFHHSAGRPSDQHSPAVSRRQSEEHSVHDFSSRGTSPAPSSVNTSRISLDHAQDRSMDEDDDDHQMDVQDDHSHSSHPHEFNKSFEGVAKIVELDQPVTAGKLDFDLGSNFENSISVDEWSNCSGDELDNSGVGQDASMLDPGHASMKMGDVDVDMDMRSALDRLMDDVAGAHATPYAQRRRTSSLPSPPSHVERSATDTILYDELRAKPPMPPPSPPPPPAPPAKDAIKARERMILQKRRAARRQEEGDYDEEDEDAEYSRPARRKEVDDRQHLDVTRPSRRRSLSTGDVEAARKEEMLMEVGGVGLSDSIEKELQKLTERPQQDKNKKYLVREREIIYASSSKPLSTKEEYDLADKAWKAIRRPSDMNEYAKQIREYRAQEKNVKAYGKVFVKVVGVKSLDVPLPNEPTALTCTLNNGIHFVTTPECELGPETRIEQEFELIEHSKLEFTLTLKIRRDPHIVQQFKDVLPTPPPRPIAPPPPPVVQQSSSRGMRSFFSSSPKKSAKDKVVHQPPPPPPVQAPQRITNNLARYLKPDCTLARAFVSFKEIANRCDTRLFETTYPLIGQRVELGGKLSTCQVGEIVLQIFRLPPLPGIPPEQLPQSLDECLRGLRHINWHKVTYFEGTLTQLGGDCNTWRRRRFRVIGSSLVAFNDVTKRATATIDLKKTVNVEDNQDRENAAKSRNRDYSEDDDLFGVERSFRLLFPNDQVITFFADSDEEKARWLDVFRALIGHIPPHPLWGELLWQRQEEAAKALEVPATQPAPQPAPQPAAQPVTQPAPQPTPLSTLARNNTPQTQNASPSWLVPRGAKR